MYEEYSHFSQACQATVPQTLLGTQSNWSNWVELVFCRTAGKAYADSQMQNEVTETAIFQWPWSHGKAVYIWNVGQHAGVWMSEVSQGNLLRVRKESSVVDATSPVWTTRRHPGNKQKWGGSVGSSSALFNWPYSVYYSGIVWVHHPVIQHELNRSQ